MRKNTTEEISIDTKIDALIHYVLNTCRDTIVSDAHKVKVKESGTIATNKISDGDENFEGFLPLSINADLMFSYSLSQLEAIRNECRSIVVGNDIAKNIVKHYQNHIVGDGPIYELVQKQTGKDPEKLAADQKESTLRTQLIANWEAFELDSHLYDRLDNIIERVLRDGECPIRVFKQGSEVPKIRFIDPKFISAQGSAGAADKDNVTMHSYGVKAAKDDIETIIGYYYTQPGTQTLLIPAESIIFIKRNTDYEFPRGIPDFWTVLTNIRRVEKIVQNTSVLVQIQSAIALIRKHKGQTQARVSSLVSKQSDGRTRSDTETGKSVTSRKFRPGMILDGSGDIDYEMPSSNVNIEGFVKASLQDLAKIAANFVLPVDWLVAKEPTSPLSPGSPVVKNFIREQTKLYSYITVLFWKVQELMGVNIEAAKLEYDLVISGPRLAVGKAIDEARVAQILQTTQALSPQSISAMFGYKYAIERANTIRHRNSLQKGEVAPGDLGNTDPGRNNGIDSKKGGTKADNAEGGNTKESTKVVSVLDRDSDGNAMTYKIIESTNE